MSNVDEHIRRAMEEGKFDDLPGKGKPIKLEENPFENPEWRVAHHLLRGSGFSLPWIERRRDIETELEEARTAFRRSWSWRVNALAANKSLSQIEIEWKRALEIFREKIVVINQNINSYNLEVPSDHFQIAKINFEREVRLTTMQASDTLTE